MILGALRKVRDLFYPRPRPFGCHACGTQRRTRTPCPGCELPMCLRCFVDPGEHVLDCDVAEALYRLAKGTQCPR